MQKENSEQKLLCVTERKTNIGQCIRFLNHQLSILKSHMTYSTVQMSQLHLLLNAFSLLMLHLLMKHKQAFQ